MTDTSLVNRELSWLEFNARVLEEATDQSCRSSSGSSSLPYSARTWMSSSWCGSRASSGRSARATRPPSRTGLTPAQTLQAVSRRVPELARRSIAASSSSSSPCSPPRESPSSGPRSWTRSSERFLDEYFHRTLLPIVTPLAIDPGHPFPHLANRSLCLVVSLARAAPSRCRTRSMAVVHLPAQVVPRFVPLPAPGGQYPFMLLDDVIRLHLPCLFHGSEVRSCHAIRVTRDADLPVRGRAEDLLTSIEQSLRDRRMGDPVRLQYDSDLPPDAGTLVDELELGPQDLYAAAGLHRLLGPLQSLYAVTSAASQGPAPAPPSCGGLREAPDIWTAIRGGDVLAHHPYHSFDAVTRFVHDAAADPKVLAIKMTLYRVSPTSPIAQALTRAAENGKEVAALVELQARFDEEANIRWARALEEVGAHVVYGLVGYKTHCKACLVVRQDADGIRRYCHLATGNYNVRTAGVYGDLGLFTSRESLGEDVTALFNLLTGYTRPRGFHHLVVAPTGLRDGLITRIRREAEHARAGGSARLIPKMNALVDPS